MGAAGAHPRVASLGLRPIHLQPPPYRSIENLQGGEISRDSVSRSLVYFPKKIVSSSFCFFLF